MVRTLASKGRDPSLILDALEDLVAAGIQPEPESVESYKKVAVQCRKMEDLPKEEFGVFFAHAFSEIRWTTK